LYRTWRSQRVAITADVIAFAVVGEQTLLDAIPLAEVVGVESLDHKDLEEHQPKNSFERIIDFRLSFQIRTLPDGKNAGRKYFLRGESDEQVTKLIRDLIHLAQTASDRAAARSRWAKAQRVVRNAYNSDPIQGAAAFLIIAVRLRSASARAPQMRPRRARSWRIKARASALASVPLIRSSSSSIRL
jgi:hypothetical protein